MKKVFLTVLLGVTFCFTGSLYADVIKVGAIFDLSGATGTGLDYAEGVRDYVQSLNDKGGILGGQNIVLKEFDNEWKVPVALKGYENLVRNEKINVMFGYGTGPSIAISPKTTQDKVLYMGGGCYVQPLANGKKTPYVFFVGITYSDELMLMGHHFMETWKESRKPKWQCFLPAAFNFVGDRAKKYLVEVLNMEALPYIDMSARDVDASTQMLQAKKRGPDLMSTVSGTKGIAGILQARHKRRMTNVPSNSISYAVDLDIIRMAGKSADGAITNDYTIPWGSDVPGMNALMAFNKKHHPEVKFRPMNYKRGWLTAMVLFEGVKRAGSMEPTKIKEALEGLKDFNPGGLTANISFSPENHKGMDATYIYEIVYGSKEFKKIGYQSFSK